MSVDNLNDIPPELRPLAPFLQRAQELKQKDPTMSYWCNYYAVQQGVHLKPRDKNSRNYLMKLMAPLEVIRNDPSSTVVVNNDPACTYIEDFALRVFDAADNEDRRGDATRGTAKKFLAAANFLELLKVFEDDAPSQPSTSMNEITAFSRHKEKIRYAKWKAADIAKAFREGRKPAPGPAHAPASVTSPGQDQILNTSNSVGFPRDLSPATQFAHGLSPHGSAAASPNPGNSRNQSVSPGQRQPLLPFTNTGQVPGLNGSYFPNPRPSGFHSPPQATSPTTTTPPRPLGHPRPRSISQSQADAPFAAFSRPPQPPRDVLPLLTPAKPVIAAAPLPPGTPNPNGIFTTPQGKSPGTWSTAATPGGLDRSGGTPSAGLGLVQASPSRVPANMANGLAKMDDAEASYPPRPYPAAKFSPPGTGRNTGTASNASTAGTPNRQETFSVSPYPPATPVEGYYNNKLSQIRDAQAAAEANENDDHLGPLGGAKPAPKRVRWTASVAGGSTVGSESPGNSPKSSPPPTLPVLADSSDSSAGGDTKFSNDVRFAGPGKIPAGGSPPTSIEDFQPTAKHTATPAAVTKEIPPIVPKKPQQFISHSATNSLSSGLNYTAAAPPINKIFPVTSSNNSSPRLAKSSPRNSPMNSPRARASDLPVQQVPTPVGTPHGSSFLNQASILSSTQFPVSVSPPISSPSRSVASLPGATGTRLRRMSASAMPTATSAALIGPTIKPFVPLFGAAGSGLPTPTGSSFTDRNSPRASPTPPRSGTPTRALSPLSGKAVPASLPFRQITAAKKHSKFASSALEFDDIETAREELLRALEILNGERTE